MASGKVGKNLTKIPRATCDGLTSHPGQYSDAPSSFHAMETGVVSVGIKSHYFKACRHTLIFNYVVLTSQISLYPLQLY